MSKKKLNKFMGWRIASVISGLIPWIYLILIPKGTTSSTNTEGPSPEFMGFFGLVTASVIIGGITSKKMNKLAFLWIILGLYSCGIAIIILGFLSPNKICDTHKIIQFEEEVGISPRFGWKGKGRIRKPKGYLIDITYMQKTFFQRSLLNKTMRETKIANRDLIRQKIEAEQGRIPWLICDYCVRYLQLSDADLAAARDAAKQWWLGKPVSGHIPKSGTGS